MHGFSVTGNRPPAAILTTQTCFSGTCTRPFCALISCLTEICSDPQALYLLTFAHDEKGKTLGTLCYININMYLCAAILQTKHNFHLTSMMNQYETVFIMTPVLSDQQMKETVEKFKGILTAEGAEIINEENWGLKKMAYPIEKKSTGFYQLLEFKAEPHVIDKLEIGYRRDERVIRFLTVKLEKYAALYAEKRRNNKKSKED